MLLFLVGKIIHKESKTYKLIDNYKELIPGLMDNWKEKVFTKESLET